MVTARYVDIMSNSLDAERYSFREGKIIIIIITYLLLRLITVLMGRNEVPHIS
jgi:hypothetical protein